MRDAIPKSSAAPARDRPGSLNPLGYLRKLREDRFQRQREELTGYLRAATPIALLADRLYHEWREAVAEPVQDGQKAGNLSAIYWWQITERLIAFRQLSPPKAAAQYHKLFAEALWNASQGAEIAKNGFRFNKFSALSRSMGYLDRYLELMDEAERELGRLLRKYRLVEYPEEGPAGRPVADEGASER